MKIRTYRFIGYYKNENDDMSKIDITQMAKDRLEGQKWINIIGKAYTTRYKDFRGYGVEEYEYETKERTNKYIGEEIWTWPQQ